MSTRITAAKNRTSTKVIASLGVVGTAAAIAGMGTFGTFTDSTDAVNTNADTGVLSINLGYAASYATVPAISGGLIPGDTKATPFDITNDGTVGWGALGFTSWATQSSEMDTDAVDGLQLTLEDCPVSWTVTGPGTYACGAGATELYSGPIVAERSLQGATSVEPGGVDHLLASIELPETAGNVMQGKVSTVAFTFTAVQRTGAAR
ncbi:hypothetical protein [Blastococcus sp. LR1]|uniref:hypothetical protein n=1 Tax=Blastococcus sp. LR1 TaxID=2877000 RepID=UPI001CCE223B|nr:hypothetical protein [Blastococcus sp. LR1]MCA0144855.1 hypothetical protein [Blastococcus sp. LR1]